MPRLMEMLARAKQVTDTERATAIGDALLGLIDELRKRRLQIGAAGELLMRGELSEIVPLDSELMHQAANPIRDGKVVRSGAEVAAREEAMVARLVASDEPISVTVLGVGHDLRTRLERRGVEYKRVMPGQVERLLQRLE